MDYLNNLINEFLSDLTVELQNDVNFNEEILQNKIKAEIREVIYIRKYPSNFTDADILSDLNNLYPLIRGRIRYEWNTIGAEGESNHTENGISRSFRSKSRLYPILTYSVIV